MTKTSYGKHHGTCTRYEEYCANCEYSKTESGHHQSYVYCRFNPPIAVVSVGYQDREEVIARWPEVPGSAWCQRWKKKREE